MIQVGFSHLPTRKSSRGKDLSCHTIYGNTQSSFDLLTGVCVVVRQWAKVVKAAKTEQKEDNETSFCIARLCIWF